MNRGPDTVPAMTVAMVAEHLNVSRQFVLRLIHRNELTATRHPHLPGQPWLVTERELDRWVQIQYERQGSPTGQAMWDQHTSGSHR